jgi:tetratricopeptide (TPR) repeat protein
MDALKAAESPDDVILAHAWLAQTRDRQGEPVEAVRHARLALTDQRPLEQGTTVALLKILTRSADRELALDAATALVDVHRELLRRSPYTPESLRDLSISLDNVAGIQQQRGQLDEALDAYTEALRWYSVLDERYGPP